jgi:hypothetical protein
LRFDICLLKIRKKDPDNGPSFDASFILFTFKFCVMAKYSKKSSEKVEEVMKEMKEGKLRSGRSGKKVTNPKQAIAIALSEARAEGDKVPKKAAPKKMVAAKKVAPKKKAAARKKVTK